jgi:hypothetical protein
MVLVSARSGSVSSFSQSTAGIHTHSKATVCSKTNVVLHSFLLKQFSVEEEEPLVLAGLGVCTRNGKQLLIPKQSICYHGNSCAHASFWCRHSKVKCELKNMPSPMAAPGIHTHITQTPVHTQTHLHTHTHKTLMAALSLTG